MCPAARSPVFSHLSSSLQGLWTIRAFGAEERFQKAFNAQQDLHSEAWFLLLTTSRWFAVRLHGICSIFVTVTTFGRLLLRDCAAEVRGGGAARAVGDGSGRVGLHLQWARGSWCVWPKPS
ncbi:multidrug resistance-associated protein 4-like isoform X2 [Sebastes umbrosus]|uniref:multidrug resistance-associated protein 4-like isoform X2 n=1 Tax=Sebastes umbrosus TaxID=72105 RepID=UPI00189EF1EB|nr:multidrug resistance-associated protein 4-like isoform X2 [Sebastes umbrosus]